MRKSRKERLTMRGTTNNRNKKIAPIVITVLVVLYLAPLVIGMSALAGFFGASDAPVVMPLFLLYAVAGGAVIVGVIMAMVQRLREIDEGEEEDAKKY